MDQNEGTQNISSRKNMSNSKFPHKNSSTTDDEKNLLGLPYDFWMETTTFLIDQYSLLLQIQQWFVSGKWLQIKPRFLHVLEIFNLYPLDLFRRELQELQKTSNFTNFISQQSDFCQRRTWKLQVISFNSAMGTWPNALTLFVEMVALHLQSRGLDVGGTQNGCFLH